MKKWLAISLVLLLAFTLVAPAAAQTPTPTGTPPHRLPDDGNGFNCGTCHLLSI